MNLGFSHDFIRNTIYTLAFLFGIAAAFLDKIGKIVLFIILFVVVIFLSKILALSKIKDDK